jgi:hypothetical protein
MHLARREASKCALCAFRVSEWETFNAGVGGGRRSYRVRKVRGGPLNTPRTPSKESGVVWQAIFYQLTSTNPSLDIKPCRSTGGSQIIHSPTISNREQLQEPL